MTILHSLLYIGAKYQLDYTEIFPNCSLIDTLLFLVFCQETRPPPRTKPFSYATHSHATHWRILLVFSEVGASIGRSERGFIICAETTTFKLTKPSANDCFQ